MLPDEHDGGLELVADGLSFPTSLTFDAAGTAYVAELGLPFGGARLGDRIGWLMDGRMLSGSSRHLGRLLR